MKNIHFSVIFNYQSWLNRAIILFLLIISVTYCNRIENSKPLVARQGVLDLKNINLATSKPVGLNGQWKFFWKQLIDPMNVSVLDNQIVSKKKHTWANLPGVWNSYIPEKTNLNYQGYATYSLTILLKDNSQPLSLKLMPMDTAYNLYVNGDLVASNGFVSTDKHKARPEWKPQLVDLVSRNNKLELMLHISNFDLNAGGPFYPIFFGNTQQIRNLREKGILRDAFLFGVLCLFGIYHLWIYGFRRKDRSALYFGLASLCASLHTLTHGEKLFFEFFSAWSWEFQQKFNVTGGYLLLPLWAGFLRHSYTKFFHIVPIRIIQITSIIFILIVLVFPARVHFQTGVPFYFVNMAVYIYAIVVLSIAVFKRQSGAVLFLLGVTVILMAVVHDLFFELGLVHDFPLYSIGIVLFFLFQSIAQAALFSNAFKSVEILSTELEARNKSLVRLDQMKDDFLANTSHELRTPLNGIIGISESLLQGAAGKLHETVKNNLRLVASSGRRLSSLVNDILDFSKLRHGDIQLNLRPIDLQSIVEVVMSLSQPLVADKNIELVHVRTDVPKVLADENRLEQILHNLLGNAIKFTKEGRISIKYKVIGDNYNRSMGALENSTGNTPMLEISIIDTGIGIPEQKQKIIFKSFTQADGSIAREYSGTGLGLSITKRLVYFHGGTIRVDSSPGLGSQFHFTLPVASKKLLESFETKQNDNLDLAANELSELETTDQSFTDPLLNSALESDQMEIEPDDEIKATVLIVDDDPVNLQVLRNQLSLFKYNIKEAANGKDALALLDTEQNFDLVLLDVMMPGLSGYDVCQILRKNHSATQLPVILLTAKNRIQDLVAGFDSGANDFLTKPFDIQELQARIKTMIRLKKAARSQSDLAAMQTELNVAREIQQSLIPKSIPHMDGIQIAARYRAMESVGGDYYDFMPGENSLGVMIADVSGHGVPAALIVSMIKIAFWFHEDRHKNTDEVFASMNEILEGNIGNEFVTACNMHLNIKNRQFITSNAGHPPLLLYKKKTGKIKRLRPMGRILGMLPNAIFETTTCELDAGDRILLYTDGIYEAHDAQNEQFGETRLHDFIASNTSLSPDQFADCLIDEIIQWSGGDSHIDDDIALVVIDIT